MFFPPRPLLCSSMNYLKQSRGAQDGHEIAGEVSHVSSDNRTISGSGDFNKRQIRRVWKPQETGSGVTGKPALTKKSKSARTSSAPEPKSGSLQNSLVFVDNSCIETWIDKIRENTVEDTGLP